MSLWKPLIESPYEPGVLVDDVDQGNSHRRETAFVEDICDALVAGVDVQRVGLIPAIVGMGVVYVVVMIAMFFNSALRGMDVRREPTAKLTDVRRQAQDGETMIAPRTTDIH